MNGIDISRYQPANITDIVDYDFVIIKATQGTNLVSKTCNEQYAHAKARGKLLGVYHFANGLDARAEAEFFVDNIKGYIGEAILVLDYEADAIKMGREWVRVFLRKVKELTGVNPILYVSRSVYDAQNLAEVLAQENCGLWLAAYPSTKSTGYYKPDNQRGEIIRQYTSSGKLDGYRGRLDLDYAYITAEQWRAYTSTNGVAPTPSAPTKYITFQHRGNVREQPTTKSNVFATYDKGASVKFDGYVHGEVVDGSDKWLRSSRSKKYVHESVTGGVYGLPDLGTVNLPSQPSNAPQTGSNGLIPQNGTYRATVNMKVRRSPSTSGEFVCTFTKGAEQRYDSYIDANGYRWVSWIGASGNRNYVARRNFATGEIYGVCF